MLRPQPLEQCCPQSERPYLSHLNLSGNNLTNMQKYASMVFLSAVRGAIKINHHSMLRGLITMEKSPSSALRPDLGSQER